MSERAKQAEGHGGKSAAKGRAPFEVRAKDDGLAAEAACLPRDERTGEGRTVVCHLGDGAFTPIDSLASARKMHASGWEVEAFAPGRTELAGNHVDHQGGLVLTAATMLGVRVQARQNGLDAIRVKSDGYGEFSIDWPLILPVFADGGAVSETGPRAARRFSRCVDSDPGVATPPASAVLTRPYTTPAGFDDREYPGATSELGCVVDTTVEPNPLPDPLAPRPDERGTSAALVRGMAAQLRLHGVLVGGCDLRVVSSLTAGGGLSSSAAFELAVGAALARLFSDSAASFPGPFELARMGCAVENGWFGKPCGLMDQTASACGGIVAIDFARAIHGGEPVVTPVGFSFESAGYAVCLVDVGCDHSRYPDEFARIPQDMAAAAHLCGADVLGDVSEDDYLMRFGDIRCELGDRAALRGLHFFNEQRLTRGRILALQARDMDEYLKLTRASGASSAQLLQNIACEPDFQPVMVALAQAERLLGHAGACRVHGGGFGGSIQAYVPTSQLEAFVRGMESQLGCGCVQVLQVSDVGARAWRR